MNSCESTRQDAQGSSPKAQDPVNLWGSCWPTCREKMLFWLKMFVQHYQGLLRDLQIILESS